MKLRVNSSSAVLAAVLSLSAVTVYAKSGAQWQALTASSQVSLTQAVEKALAFAPGRVLEVELEHGKRGAPASYEVSLVSDANEEVKLHVNAVTGEVRKERNKGQAKLKEVRRLMGTELTLAQAVEAAVAHTPGKPLEAELDSRDEHSYYEVKVLQADQTVMKVKLDAVTGKVLQAKRD